MKLTVAAEFVSFRYAMPTTSGGGPGCSGRIFNRGPDKQSKRWETSATAAACLDCRDETGGTVVFFYNLWRATQRREEVSKPRVMLGIVGQREGDESLPRDLFQPDFARPRQRMCRMHGHADGVTL